MQRQGNEDDPFHRNRANEGSAKRQEHDKKKQYAAELLEQMAMKK